MMVIRYNERSVGRFLTSGVDIFNFQSQTYLTLNGLRPLSELFPHPMTPDGGRLPRTQPHGPLGEFIMI